MWAASFMWLEVNIYINMNLGSTTYAAKQFSKKGLIEARDFVFLIGLDGDYNYLKEILFWDPVSASWYDMSYTLTYTLSIQSTISGFLKKKSCETFCKNCDLES